ncbi:MAG: dTDP-4-dehydrorhamnose reductase [Sediminibacterium sp.]|nr:dTDP-4-dehydrorhamnose reductase [Sediminibacterium sp.]MBX9779122.1 dTDP-4-dehydrorhamnose reductase [Chitinophagaceae bacterium]
MKPLVVVTGVNGQLGWELQQLAPAINSFDFLFTNRDLLDLEDLDSIPFFFEKYKPSYFINCAAYTAVDKAETEKARAFHINALSVSEIAKQCALLDIPFITISTDYVFNGNGADGNSQSPYVPDSTIDPINYYGYSKAEGESFARKNHTKTIIVRTSWVYSSHGNNFVKTMLRLMKQRSEISVVADQFGSPTYAGDLASALLEMVAALEAGNTHYGTYHYSNTGIISWYEFAEAIRAEAKLPCIIKPISTNEYPTPAKRPAYSAMDSSAISTDFNIQLHDWKESLKKCLLNNTIL